MDKRQFARQSVSIDAECHFGSGNDRSCRIRDFSQGGMLITLDLPPQADPLLSLPRRKGAPATVSFRLHNRRVSINVLVAHVSEHGVGLRMREHRPADLAMLQQAAQQASEHQSKLSWHPAAGQTLLEPAQKITLINSANSIISRFLENQFEGFFSQLELTLLQEADYKKTHAGQQAFLDAMTLIRAQKAKLSRHCIAGITANADAVAKGLGPEPQMDVQGDLADTASASALSLVAKDEFEDWLVVRVAISKAEVQLRELLLELQLRLDAALLTSGAAAVYNPYSPAALAMGWATALRPLQLSNELLRVVFGLFYDNVLAQLDSAYVSLNKLFIETGVLPDIDVTRYLAQQKLKRDKAATETHQQHFEVKESSPESHSAAPDTSQTSRDEGNSSETAGNRVGKGIKAAFNTVSRLWSMQRQLHSEHPEELRQSAQILPPQITARDTQDALRQLQKQLLDGNAQLGSPGALKQYLMQAGHAAGGISEYEQDSADMVESLFDNIVHNERVLDDLRAELRKLEVPILKVMLRDPELFSAEYHPARQAVNYLALLSDRRSINIVDNRPVIIDAISTILKNEGEEDEGFKQVLGDLDELVGREKHYFERNLTRVTEACEGQQRITQANLLIEWELDRLLAPQPVGKPILDLVNQGWKELMRLSYFREGTSSLAWEMTLVVLDQLIVRTVPGAWDESRLRFSSHKLLTLIRKGLSKIPDSNASHKTVVQNLEKLLDYPHSTDFATVQYVSPLHSNNSIAGQSAEVQPDKTLQRWIKRAKALQVGQWLQRHVLGSESQLYYLTWVADEFSRYVFSNHRGMKAEEMSLDQVAHLLRDGNLTVLNDAGAPALEQGLDALVQKVYDKLALDAAQDQLTGLKARREFLRWLTQSVTRARDSSDRFSLIFIDILQFKLINNTCGYEVGDTFLRNIAEQILSRLDKNAIAGRVGVDQFAVLLPSLTYNDGFMLAMQLKAALEEQRFESGQHNFIISSAVALINVDDKSPEPMELLRMVESAADMCKKSGHKDIQVIKPGDTRFRERDDMISWVTRINRALDENRLKLRCQKIQPIGETDLVHTHYEILLTVIDDNGEHLAPTNFIKAAEEYNRMGAVDRWVISAVLQWMVGNPQKLARFGGFSINLSGCSLNDESFLDYVFEMLVRYDVPREKLIFEITETAAIDNLADAADFINEMKEIGCRFSLDDFGAGQSSYAYLKQLPVDFIKIDGAFIRQITEDDFDYALVRSITEMGHFLDKSIVAEYVSNEAILDLVTKIGVDYAQGFHLGKPILLEQLLATTEIPPASRNPA
ncbi:MAG: DUF1631 family protein [Pseudomonas sp.]|nr:DUF1631 family protein [Pseudomonas sp.]